MYHGEGGWEAQDDQPKGENAKGPGGSQKLANKELVRECDIWRGLSCKGLVEREVQEYKAFFLLWTSAQAQGLGQGGHKGVSWSQGEEGYLHEVAGFEMRGWRQGTYVAQVPGWNQEGSEVGLKWVLG